jgi:hypothetical protein
LAKVAAEFSLSGNIFNFLTLNDREQKTIFTNSEMELPNSTLILRREKHDERGALPNN